MRRDALETRADRGMRAYVTGSDDARVKRDAYALRPHATSCVRARWLAAHERREGHCARTAQQAVISGRAQGTAGDVCVSLQASPPKVATQGQRGTRWSPSYRRGRAKEARARTVALLRYVDVAGCTAPRLARGGTLLRTSRPSRPEQRNNVARSSEGQTFTTGMNAWPGLLGACAGPNVATCGTTSPQTPTITFDRRIDGHCCSVVDALRRRL